MPTQPKNIFEVINQNIVDLSKDMVAMFQKIDAIHKALYPIEDSAEPTNPGAETNNK